MENAFKRIIKDLSEDGKFYSCCVIEWAYGSEHRQYYVDAFRPPRRDRTYGTDNIWLFDYEKENGTNKANELRITMMALYEEAFLNGN